MTPATHFQHHGQFQARAQRKLHPLIETWIPLLEFSHMF